MAAAVCIPPSPHESFSNMSTSTRRAPLASIPHAANSPHRLINTSGSKRPRSIANVSQQENEPPAKRHIVDRQTINAAPSTPRRQLHTQQDRVQEKRNGGGNDSSQNKLVAVRDKDSSKTQVAENHPVKDQEAIRQWQQHTRKMFPKFSIYFESIPEDARARFAKQATFLGAVSSPTLLLSVARWSERYSSPCTASLP